MIRSGRFKLRESLMTQTAAAQKQTYGVLIILFYFTVFSVIPLSHIHVEDKSSRIVNVLSEHNKNAESFLTFLHKILSLHFKDRADHALSANILPSESIKGAKPVENDTTSQFTPLISQYPKYCLSRTGKTILYPTTGVTGSKKFKGFHTFYSSLSPPLA